MKTGLTLEEMAAEITRQSAAKSDYAVDTGKRYGSHADPK